MLQAQGLPQHPDMMWERSANRAEGPAKPIRGQGPLPQGQGRLPRHRTTAPLWERSPTANRAEGEESPAKPPAQLNTEH